MAVRTVTVNLNLNATRYIATGRRVVAVNRDIDRSFSRIARSSVAAAAGTDAMTTANRRLARAAGRAQNQVADLRREINRLRRAQSRLGGPIQLIQGGGRAGAAMGGGFLQAIMRMFSALPAPVQAAIAGGLAGAIAAGSTMIGAAFGGALLTGLGAGGLAAGIVSAAQDPDVRKAFGAFGLQVKGDFKEFGDAFQVPLIEAATHFRDRWATVAPEIRGMLAELSVAVKPLSVGMTGFVEKALPGLRAGLQGAVPILDTLAKHLPGLGKAFGDFFGLLGRNSKSISLGFAAFLNVVEFGIRGLGLAIAFLANSFLGLMKTIGIVLNVMAELASTPAIGHLFGGSWMQGLNEKFQGFLEGANTAGEGLDGVRFKADGAASAIEGLTATTATQINAFYSAREANRAYEESLDALTASVKENGRSLDEGTAKGRANNQMWDDGVRAAERARQANIANGMSIQQANAIYNQQIERLRQTAISAGFAADKINALAQAASRMPTGEKTLRYNVVTKFITQGSPTYRAIPGVQVAQRDGGIVYARDGLMALGGHSGIASGGRPLIGFAEPGTGGEAFIARNAPPGRSLAIANQAAGWHGGMVVPKGYGGHMTTVNLTVNAGMGTDGRAVGRQILKELRPVIEAKGGNVQVAVMGRR